MTPVLRYPGAKWGLAPWIISHFPPHESYIEPFFGSGAVLLRKQPARAELVNDIDGLVVAFFRSLRDQPQELAAALHMTPYARDELLACREIPEDATDVEKARRLAVSCWQTRGGAQSGKRPGWRFDMTGAANKSLAGTWASLPSRILATAARFVEVAIENRPALEVVTMVQRRGRDCLIYADPPYVSSTADPRLYRYRMTNADHLELLDALDQHLGPVVLSGYHSELYDDRLGHWTTVTHQSRNQVNEQRTEVIWLNPVAARHATLGLHLELP